MLELAKNTAHGTILLVRKNFDPAQTAIAAEHLDGLTRLPCGAVPRFVNDGEALVGLTLEDNALEYVRAGGNVAIVYPEDGTSTVADGIALVKGAPNADNAKVFLDWLLSKPVQEFVVKEIGRRPVRSDVAATGLKPLGEIKLVNYDMGKIASNRTQWIADWRKALQNR